MKNLPDSPIEKLAVGSSSIGYWLFFVSLVGATAIIAFTSFSLWNAAKAESIWRSVEQNELAKKGELDRLTGSLGYGGLIHNFKNYVIRREEHYADQFTLDRQAIQETIDRFTQIPGTTPEELELVDKLSSLVDAYRASFELIDGQTLSIGEIDRLAFVDDQDYFESLRELRKLIDQRLAVAKDGLSTQFNFAQSVALFAGVFGVLATLGLGLPLAWRTQRMVEFRTREATQFALAFEKHALEIEAAHDETYKLAQRLEIATDSSEVGIWEYDTVAEHLMWDKTMFELYGLPQSADLVFDSWADRVHPDDRTRAVREVKEVFTSGQKFDTTFRILTPAGELKHLRAAASVYRDGSGVERLVGSNWDITKSTLAIENLNEAQRLGQIGNWSWDVQKNVVEWSDQIYTLFGIEKTDGKIDLEMAASLYTDESQLRLQAAVQETLETGTAYSIELETRHCANGVRYVRGQGRARYNSEGVICGLFGTAMNVTKSRTQEESLRDAKMRSEAANLSKSEFLANMSHEIRTPMTAILGYADLLEVDGEITSDPRQALDAIRTIKANSEHLLTIINDILDMSKIESGKMAVESIDTFPTLILEEVVNLVQCQCDGKRLGLHVIYESPIPKRIESDPTRLRQILLNLLGNAIKFTEVGSVTVSASFHSETNSLHFAITDTGIGMASDQRDIIARFEAFSQADSSTTRKFGGSGLGLRICNSLASMLGGGITIESEMGSGSRFTLAIDIGNPQPLEFFTHAELKSSANKAHPQKSTSQSVSKDALLGTRVLLAEDGPDNQRLISFHLKKAGAEVCVAENGLVAVHNVEQTNLENRLPDIILMDMQMPEMDGYTATRRLRELGYTMPIVALTAHAMDGDRQKCLDAGCDEYLTKPIEKARLIEVCDSITKGISGLPVATASILQPQAPTLS
jgi:signal transduction histidine kinase/CheY-like chemotaxis protein